MRTPLRPYRRGLLCLLLLVGAVACAVDRGKVYVKDGQLYGVTPGAWRERWWNYYQRGSSYAEGGFWQEAVHDFQAAIAQRAADERLARTYGLHFIGYFPHRELGIAYYHLQRYPEAIHELEASLRSVDSAKAKFYLNRARRALLEQTGRDTAPPIIRVDSPRDGFLTNELSVKLVGHAEDDSYVAGVTIHGLPLFIELAEPRLAFAQEIPLRDGPNEIDISAVDLVGRRTHRRITVESDRQGPMLGVNRIDLLGEPPQRRARLHGFLADRSGVVRLALGDRSVAVRPARDWEFLEEVPLTAGSTSIPFEAQDAAGNVTRGEIALSPTEDQPPGIRKGQSLMHPLPRWAFLPASASPSIDDLGALPPLSTRASQDEDRTPPLIKLTSPPAAQTVFFDDRIYLEGSVSDASDITAFSINGEALLRRRGRQLFFNYLAPLQLGNNHFVLEAIDTAGNRALREIVVTREGEEVRRLDSRLRVVLLPFAKEGETSVLGEAIYDSLLSAFVNQPRFQFIERGQLEAILRELKLSQTALVDPTTPSRIGKIAAAEGILTGSVTETSRALEVFLRLVDVETAIVLASADVYQEELTLRDVKPLMEGLAWKIRQRFPLVEGSIVAREGKTIFTDLTQEHHVQKHMKLIVFRDGGTISDPRHERPLRKPGRRLGEARIQAVSAELSEAVLLEAEESGDVQQLDKVITK